MRDGGIFTLSIVVYCTISDLMVRMSLHEFLG